MVTPLRLLPALAILSLAACDDSRYAEPISHYPHGSATRANMAAMIINPVPPAPVSAITDANRAVLSNQRYRTDEVKDPTEQSTAPDTGALQ